MRSLGSTPPPPGEKTALVNLAVRLVSGVAKGDYQLLFSHVTEDIIYIAADTSVIRGAANLRALLDPQPEKDTARPAYLVRKPRFNVVHCASPTEAIVVGTYLTYSELTANAISSERQRATLCMRRCEDTWRAYHVHLSAAWQPVDDAHRFPFTVSEQTYRYVQAILRAAKRMGGTDERLALASGRSVLYVDPSLIMYVEAADKHCILHTTDGSTEVHRLLGDVEQLLPADFLRISRKHVVNRAYLLNVASSTVTLVDGTELPVPKRRMPEVRRALKKAGQEGSGRA